MDSITVQGSSVATVLTYRLNQLWSSPLQRQMHAEVINKREVDPDLDYLKLNLAKHAPCLLLHMVPNTPWMPRGL